MAININALDMFRTSAQWDGKGIANLDGDDGIKQVGRYKGPLGKLGRTKTEEAENNKVRTELLKALGNAFDLSGMTETDGKVTFTKAFMDTLEQLLGTDFKRDDFKMDREGNVTSGRPLTARRITAIIAKVEEAAAGGTGKTKSTGSAGKTVGAGKTGAVAQKPAKSVTGGIRNDKAYAPYVAKLDIIKKDLAKLDKDTYKHVHSFFGRVDKTLDYIYNEVDVEREKESAPDPSGIRNDQEYEFKREFDELKEGERPKYEFYNNKTGKFEAMEGKAFSDYLWNRLGGGLLHTERADFRKGESEDVAPLRKYVVDNLRLFVMKSIDTYLACKDAGKLEEFYKHLEKPGACIEDQCVNMISFEGKHLTADNALSVDEVKELERIADQAKAPEVNRQIADIFDDLNRKEPWFQAKEEFDDDVAKALEGKLLGKTCTITKMNSDHTFSPVMENDKPVVRKLTPEDIRTFGKMIFDATFI